MANHENSSLRDHFISHLSNLTFNEVLDCLRSALEHLAHEAAEDGDFKQEQERRTQAQAIRGLAT